VLGSVSMTGGADAWVSGEVLFLKVYYGIFFPIRKGTLGDLDRAGWFQFCGAWAGFVLGRC
jgi:hypothetical protein